MAEAEETKVDLGEVEKTNADLSEDPAEEATISSMPSPEEQVIHSCFCLLVCENFIRII